VQFFLPWFSCCGHWISQPEALVKFVQFAALLSEPESEEQPSDAHSYPDWHCQIKSN